MPIQLHSLCALVALAAGPVLAQSDLVESQKLTPVNDGFAGARYGHDVALSGDTAVVAAAFRGAGTALHDGRCYVYSRASAGAPWEYTSTLFPQGSASGECFGQSVAIDGDVIAIGSACEATTGGGAVYVFRRAGGTWQFEARLAAPSNQPGGGGFGFAVDVHQGTLVVGDPVQSGNGRVYVYRWNGSVWTSEATLAPAAGSSGQFGSAVALDGDALAVGQVRRSLGAGGEVRVYRRAGAAWSFEQAVQPSTASYGQYVDDAFGAAVDLVGATLLVGAPDDRLPSTPSTQGRGAAFVFTRGSGTWTQAARLDPLAAVAQSRFGSSVALGGVSYAAIGANGLGAASPADPSRGTVHTFARTGGAWSVDHRITALGGAVGDNFGTSVAIAPHGTAWTLFAGAPGALSGDAGAAHVFAVDASAYFETQRLLEPVHSFDRFGTAVAVDGDFAVVGAPLDDTQWGQNSGSAHVFERNGATWRHVAELTTSILSANDRFGTSVAISGTLAAVGAPNDDHSAGSDLGSVFLFERSGAVWTLISVLDANDAAPGDLFGTCVSIRAGLVAIGAPLDDNAAGVNAGAAYLFRSNAGVWSQAAKLASNDLAAGDFLGTSVAVVSSTRVLVGAPGDDFAGAAYVFDSAPIIGGVVWSQRTKLTPSDGASGDDFGRAVAAAGQRLVVGAPLHDTFSGVDTGAGYYFQSSGTPGTLGNTFTQVRKLTDPGAAAGDQLGASAAIDATLIALGMPGDDNANGVDAGALRVYRPQTASVWISAEEIAANGGTLAGYGSALALGVGALLCGAPLDTNEAGGNAGAVHVVDTWLGGSVGSNYCVATVNASGQAAAISASGTPVRASNDLVLHAAHLPVGVAGFFLTSRASGFVALAGGSRGNLCLGGAIGRFVGPGQVQNSGASGALSLPVDLANLPQPSGAVVGQVGETWHFQAWFRDSGPSGATSNFTDGLAVVLH